MTTPVLPAPIDKLTATLQERPALRTRLSKKSSKQASLLGVDIQGDPWKSALAGLPSETMWSLIEQAFHPALHPPHVNILCTLLQTVHEHHPSLAPKLPIVMARLTHPQWQDKLLSIFLVMMEAQKTQTALLTWTSMLDDKTLVGLFKTPSPEESYLARCIDQSSHPAIVARRPHLIPWRCELSMTIVHHQWAQGKPISLYGLDVLRHALSLVKPNVKVLSNKQLRKAKIVFQQITKPFDRLYLYRDLQADLEALLVDLDKEQLIRSCRSTPGATRPSKRMAKM